MLLFFRRRPASVREKSQKMNGGIPILPSPAIPNQKQDPAISQQFAFLQDTILHPAGPTVNEYECATRHTEGLGTTQATLAKGKTARRKPDRKQLELMIF